MNAAKETRGGCCENCKRRETCKKIIGFMFGGCKVDFEPENKNKNKRGNVN
ncbi:MAG: hypothetical protein IKU25_05195 [Clostridia bacterium]|nr:hypothetical protein [Clostridia bacterium]